MQSLSETELLTVEQFAERLQVSRATVFNWMQKQILAPGKHFIRFGRVLRFTWSADLVAKLLHESAQALPVAVTMTVTTPVALTRKKTGSPINWGY